MKDPIRPEVLAQLAALPRGPYALSECLAESRRQLRPIGITQAEFRYLGLLRAPVNLRSKDESA